MLQQLWNVEIQSLNGKKTHLSHPPPTQGTYIFPPNNKPCDIQLETTQRHHQWSHRSHCWGWPFTSLSAPFSRFLRNNAWIKAASWERKYTLFFGKIPVFSIRVFDIHARVRWGLVLVQGLFPSYRAFFWCNLSLFTFVFQNFRWKEVWE